MSRFGRAMRRAVGWDARSGMKVRADKLRADGELAGMMVLDADPVHPQRYVRPPPPDGLWYRPSAPRHDKLSHVHVYGWTGDPADGNFERLQARCLALQPITGRRMWTVDSVSIATTALDVGDVVGYVTSLVEDEISALAVSTVQWTWEITTSSSYGFGGYGSGLWGTGSLTTDSGP